MFICIVRGGVLSRAEVRMAERTEGARLLSLTSPEGEVAALGFARAGGGGRATEMTAEATNSERLRLLQPPTPHPPPAGTEAVSATSPSRGEVKDGAGL